MVTETTTRSGSPVKTIVVVDDSPDFLELMQALLEGEGYRVIPAGVAESAHQIIKDTNPDLLILDVRMQGKADWHVLNLVKLDPATSVVPIIVCSAAHQAIREAGSRLREQVCEVVFKPFSLNDLLEAVDRCLQPDPGRPADAAPAR